MAPEFKRIVECLKEKLLKNLGLVCLSAAVGLLTGFTVGRLVKYEPKDSSKIEGVTLELSKGQEAISSQPQESKSSMILVDIRGAIKKPGVFKLEEGSIIDQLIQKAGGFDQNYDKEWVDLNINFAKKVSEGEKVYIPYKGSVNCSSLTTQPKSSSTAAGKISINNGTVAELDNLPGIGPVIAQRIIDARPYKKLDDLLKVQGIGDSLYDKIKNSIQL